jgi:hypothetical protein
MRKSWSAVLLTWAATPISRPVFLAVNRLNTPFRRHAVKWSHVHPLMWHPSLVKWFALLWDDRGCQQREQVSLPSATSQMRESPLLSAFLILARATLGSFVRT